MTDDTVDLGDLLDAIRQQTYLLEDVSRKLDKLVEQTSYKDLKEAFAEGINYSGAFG